MTELEEELAVELDALKKAVDSPPSAGPKPDLVAIFQRIDRLASRLPADTDPSLLHYMRKKSYEKAGLWLKRRETEIEPGACGHVE